MAIQYPIKNSFNSGEWSELLGGRSDIPEYKSAVKVMENFMIHPQGGITRRGGSKYIASSKTSSKKSRLIRFEFSITEAYVLEFGENYIRFFKNKAQIESGGSPVEVTTTYTEAELFEINATQSADVLYIVHPNHPPAKLIRTSDTSWTLSDIDFLPPPFEDINIDDTYTFTASALTGAGVTITASVATFDSSDVGRKIKFEEILAARFTIWATAKVVLIGDYRYYDENLYVAASAGTTDINPPVHLEGTESDGAVNWTYVNSGFGTAIITAFTSATIVTATVVEDIPPGYTGGYHKWALDKWGGVSNGYPSVVSFFEERLWYAGSITSPQTLWGSVSGDFENFTIGANDDASLSYTISSDQVNAIQWMNPGKTLLVGTTGGEFNVTASSIDEAITPTNIKISRESTNGSSNIAPLRIGDSLLFVQRANRKIRNFQYNFQTDSYISSDITLFAEHITESGVVEIDYQRGRDDTIFVAKNDGIMATAAWLKEQSVNGWSRQILGGSGEIESVCVIPAPVGTSDDEVWISVKRTIGGSIVRYIEIILPGLLTNDVKDSTYLDSHIVYDGASTTAIAGLDHLEGETVSALVDGAAHPDAVVSSGSITLDRSGSKVCVGYNYVSKITTLNLEAGVADGNTAQGKIKRISTVILRLYRTVGAKLGSNENNIDLIPFRDSSMSMNDPIPLFTGDKKIPFRSSHETEGQIHVQQDQPLPLTLLTIMPKIRTEVN